MRLFAAVNFNAGTKKKLCDIRNKLRVKSVRGRFTLDDNLHLTLIFLGECNAKQLSAATDIIEKFNFNPFTIEIDCIGRYKRGSGDLWWAGVQPSPPLIDLQNDLSSKLSEMGYKAEKRKYSPHVTLGRDVVTEIAPMQIEPFGETVRSIELMKSERINGRLTYTVMATNLSDK